MASFTYVTEKALKPSESWSNRDCVLFHLFNPRGVYAAKQAVNNEISSLVAQGKVQSGAIIAYGLLDSVSSRHEKTLRDLAMNRRVKSIKAWSAIYNLRNRVNKAREVIEKHKEYKS